MVMGAVSVVDTDVTTAEVAIDNTANENMLADYALRVDVPYAEGRGRIGLWDAPIIHKRWRGSQ